MLRKLECIIQDREKNPKQDSYTNTLLKAGYERIAQKVGEEAVELIIASGSQGRRRIIEETADLFYHLLVLLRSQDISLKEIETELEHRHLAADE